MLQLIHWNVNTSNLFYLGMLMFAVAQLKEAKRITFFFLLFLALSFALFFIFVELFWLLFRFRNTLPYNNQPCSALTRDRCAYHCFIMKWHSSIVFLTIYSLVLLFMWSWISTYENTTHMWIIEVFSLWNELDDKYYVFALYVWTKSKLVWSEDVVMVFAISTWCNWHLRSRVKIVHGWFQ